MLGTLTHAVVHMVAFGCDYPVVPLDIFELYVKVSLAAHGYIFTTTQRALPERMSGVVVTKTHLGHHKGLIRGVRRGVQGAKVLPVLLATNLQVQLVLATIEEGLQGAGDGEGVPVTLLDLQHLFYYQGAVGV